jgi:hypothetical protein
MDENELRFWRARTLADYFASVERRIDDKLKEQMAALQPMPPMFRYTGLVTCECTTVKACWRHG